MKEKQRLQLFDAALRAMGDTDVDKGPMPLARTMQALAVVEDISADSDDVDKVWTDILSDDPNNPARLHFGMAVRRWDNLSQADWIEDTEPLSDERRELIYEKLKFPELYLETFNQQNPVSRPSGYPLVIAEDHVDWYTPERQGLRPFYWDSYKRYLADTAGWNEKGIEQLNQSSTRVVELLSDPESLALYQTKGLVVGYVQSGKTANFTAVTAKAADAGYRLIIILAGTLDVLREQTQRRLDKELIGQEIIVSEAAEGVPHDYDADKEWGRFMQHGALPSSLGAFDWQRLTGPEADYQRLKRGIAALQFQKRVPARRFNDPENLHTATARLIVMKKNPAVLKKLNADLERIKTSLFEVPTLIIDDESDQASVNTKRPLASQVRDRTATNEQIIRLLKLLPRSQYVGYTATPFANVFIDPQDAEDLFPKDYIIALDRPDGYMGVSDFYDLAEDGSDLQEDEQPEGYSSNERAFTRNIFGDDSSEENLPKAIRSFVLSGAIKLYRDRHGSGVSIDHHTMLVHRSTKQSEHEVDRDLVERVYFETVTKNKVFYDGLEQLWEEDFLPVYKAQAPDLPMPERFQELRAFIDSCVSRIEQDAQPVRIVNGDQRWVDQLPNFDRDSIWGVLVGGTKLSRGYTVEGLTVSYYRRKIRTADTLMQVGRWFGFRRGYRDLVRLFIGRNEADGRRTMDLYVAFKAICRDEETFRRELLRYADPATEARIKPSQIPPLVPSHLLPPTSLNKRYNAVIQQQNMGGQWKERVLTATDADNRRSNAEKLKDMLIRHRFSKPVEFAYDDPVPGKSRIHWSGRVCEVPASKMLEFLENYKWSDNRPLMDRELSFLRGKDEWDPCIQKWLVILPQKASSGEYSWWSDEDLSVFERAADSVSGAFNVFSERGHRLAASCLAGVESLQNLSDSMSNLQHDQTAVMLAYPVIPRGKKFRTSVVSDKEITIGFGLQFPTNNIQVPITFGVRDPTRSEAVTIDNN